MPKRVDHDLRRRQITDAVCRITVKGGLSAATFREVAAEAGVSVRLVQYYFGTKDELLLATQRRVAERAVARIAGHLAEADGTPRGMLRALLVPFIPTDDESRENMLVFVALHTVSLVDPSLARVEALEVPRSLHAALSRHLRRADLAPGVDVDAEAAVLAGVTPSLAQSVLAGLSTAEEAIAVLDYAIDRALAGGPGGQPGAGGAGMPARSAAARRSSTSDASG
jgi:AcrR family transcriptional regulator